MLSTDFMRFDFPEIDEEVANINFASTSEPFLYGINRNLQTTMMSDDGGYTWAVLDDDTYSNVKASSSIVQAKNLPFEDWSSATPSSLAGSYGLSNGDTRFSGESLKLQLASTCSLCFTAFSKNEKFLDLQNCIIHIFIPETLIDNEIWRVHSHRILHWRNWNHVKIIMNQSNILLIENESSCHRPYTNDKYIVYVAIYLIIEHYENNSISSKKLLLKYFLSKWRSFWTSNTYVDYGLLFISPTGHWNTWVGRFSFWEVSYLVVLHVYAN